MRLATYNIEWFANLFDDRDRLIMDDSWSGRRDVTKARQAEAIAKVLTAINADAVLIVEAPNTGARQNTVRALQHFAEGFDLRCAHAVTGFASDTHQEIALLYDRGKVQLRHDPAASDSAPRFDGKFRVDLGIDQTRDVVQFSKPPLELAVQTRSGQAFRLIGVHLKSKAPHGASTRNQVLRLSIANRRKQVAQAEWLVRRVKDHLGRQDHVILLGDLNDGPGLDALEALLGKSSVDIVRQAGLFDPHAIAADGTLSTAHFLRPDGSQLEALLDYIMISPSLRDHAPSWRIWHPFNDPVCRDTPELQDALLTASDHFPVTLDIDL